MNNEFLTKVLNDEHSDLIFIENNFKNFFVEKDIAYCSEDIILFSSSNKCFLKACTIYNLHTKERTLDGIEFGNLEQNTILEEVKRRRVSTIIYERKKV